MTIGPGTVTGRTCQETRREDTMRVLFVASEIFPMAKTGGLGDVCASLPPHLAQQEVDVRLLMPGYTEALDKIVGRRVVADLGEVLPGAAVRLVAGWTPDSGLPIWLIDCPKLFDRPGTVYQNPDGADWEDNALRFGVLCHVAARLGLGEVPVGWRADVVHAHDWHTGLVPLLLHARGEPRPRSVFTIHNAAFQGCFPLDSAAQLDLPRHVATDPDSVEFYGRLSFLKAGVAYADRVTTVSRGYAREIQTPEFGFGLEGLYQARSRDLRGIMNGIDTELWNPATDPHIPRKYSVESIDGKRVCKASLQDHAGLFIDRGAPLVAFLSRLTHQKMADVFLADLPRVLEWDSRIQVAIHGQGDKVLEDGLRKTAKRYPGRVSARIGYEEDYAHRLQAGADIMLHGSRFEPCGLTQMYAMHYGTVPVVRRVGGLADTVVDAGYGNGTGFVFEEPDGNAMMAALARSIKCYRDRPEDWAEIQARGMAADFSWSRSAGNYLRLYNELAPTWSQGRLSKEGAVHVPACDYRETRIASNMPSPGRRKRRLGITPNFG